MQFFRKFKQIFFVLIPFDTKKSQVPIDTWDYLFNQSIRHRMHPKELVLVVRVYLEHRY